MKSPVFAYGSLPKLQAAIDSGKVGYPTYCWLSDVTQYAFVNKDKKIETVGLTTIVGQEESPIILSMLVNGLYKIKGFTKVTLSSEVVFYSAYMLVIVAIDENIKKIKTIAADKITDYKVTDGELTKTIEYLTSESGGGTHDYEQLLNLPQINGVTLIGNKSTEDIIPIGKGLVYDPEGKIALSYAEVSNPSGGTTVTIGS